MIRPRLPHLVTTLLLAFAATPALPAAIARTDDPHAAAFYEAFYLESGLRDFERAEQAYAAVAMKATTPSAKNYLVSALVGRGRCLIALGRRDEAKRVLDSALAIEPGHAEATRLLAPPEDSGIDPELKARITALVQKLATSEREQAAADLRRVGALALPFLADGLRSRDVAVVDQCAILLGQHSTPASCAILAAAFRDPAVVFPRSLGAALPHLQPVAGSFEVFDLASRSQDPELRTTATSRAQLFANDTRDDDRVLLIAILERALLDPDPAVSRSLTVFGRLDREIIVSLVDAWIPWFERLDLQSSLNIPDSIARIDPPLPQLEAFAAGWLRHPDPRVRSFSRMKWLAIRLEKNTIAEPVAIELVLGGFEHEPQDASESASLLRHFEIETIRAARDPLLAVAQKCLRTAHTKDDARCLQTILEELDRAKTFTEQDVAAMFATLDDRWSSLDTELAERLLGVVGLAADATLTPRERSRENDLVLRALDTVANDDLAVAIVDQRMRGRSAIHEIDANAMLEHPSSRVRARFLKRSREVGSPISGVGTIPAAKLSARAIEHLAKDLVDPDRRLAEDAFRVATEIPSPAFTTAARARYHAAPESEKAMALHFLHRCAREDARAELEAALASASDDLWSIAVGAIVEDTMLELLPRVVASAGPAGLRTRGLSNSIEGRGGLERAARRDCAVAVIDALAPEQFDGESIERYARLFDEPHGPLVLRGIGATAARARLIACEVAAKWCFEAAEPRLVELLDRDVPDVAAAASRALEAIRNRRELKTSTRLALSFDKSQAIADARELLKSDDPMKRRGGALALGALGDLSAVPQLLKLLDDRDAQVRDAVLTALGKLGSQPATTATSNSKESDG